MADASDAVDRAPAQRLSSQEAMIEDIVQEFAVVSVELDVQAARLEHAETKLDVSHLLRHNPFQEGRVLTDACWTSFSG